jgi:hypothetical protein
MEVINLNRTDLTRFMKSQLENLQADYRSIDENFEKVTDHQAPRLTLNNSQRVFYSLHGFVGTPEEMTVLDETLKNFNFDVYHDLIPGHAATAEICNDYHHEEWLADFKEKLEFLLERYEEIVLCGFSTGALIIHKYLNDNAMDSRLKKIKGLIFYSPFYQETYPFARGLLQKFVPLLKSLSLQWVYRLTGVQDLQVMLIKPQYYLSRLPLKAGIQVHNLGQEVFGEGVETKHSFPLLLFLTNVDKVADSRVSHDVVVRDFENVSLKFFQDPRVPHHLMVPEVNPLIEEVKSQSRNFISNLFGLS